MVAPPSCRPLAMPQPSKAGLDQSILRRTDDLLHARVDAGDLPGVISYVYRNGEAAHIDTYGFADVDKRLPMRMDSIVRIYSMTKCVVSVAVAICQEEGFLNFDDPVDKFIPAFADVKVLGEDGKMLPVARPVTLLHLLTHTSGLGYGPMGTCGGASGLEQRYVHLVDAVTRGVACPVGSLAITSLAHWCNELAKIPLTFQPGTAWQYSYSHDVLGHVVEVATNESLEMFLKRRIFDPLGMPDTGFAVPSEKSDRMAAVYRRVAGVLQRVDDPDEWTGSKAGIASGGGGMLGEGYAGGLVSTCADYSRFCRMLLNNGALDGVEILKLPTARQLVKNLLPRATGRDDIWCYDTPGIGFGMIGCVTVTHPELDPTLRPGQYGIYGTAGTAWTNDPAQDMLVMSVSLVFGDLTTEQELRAGVQASIDRFDRKVPAAIPGVPSVAKAAWSLQGARQRTYAGIAASARSRASNGPVSAGPLAVGVSSTTSANSASIGSATGSQMRGTQERRIAGDGKPYTRKEFLEFFGILGQFHWTWAPAARCSLLVWQGLPEPDFGAAQLEDLAKKDEATGDDRGKASSPDNTFLEEGGHQGATDMQAAPSDKTRAEWLAGSAILVERTPCPAFPERNAAGKKPDCACDALLPSMAERCVIPSCAAEETKAIPNGEAAPALAAEVPCAAAMGAVIAGAEATDSEELGAAPRMEESLRGGSSGAGQRQPGGTAATDVSVPPMVETCTTLFGKGKARLEPAGRPLVPSAGDVVLAMENASFGDLDGAACAALQQHRPAPPAQEADVQGTSTVASGSAGRPSRSGIIQAPQDAPSSGGEDVLATLDGFAEAEDTLDEDTEGAACTCEGTPVAGLAACFPCSQVRQAVLVGSGEQSAALAEEVASKEHSDEVDAHEEFAVTVPTVASGPVEVMASPLEDDFTPKAGGGEGPAREEAAGLEKEVALPEDVDIMEEKAAEDTDEALPPTIGMKEAAEGKRVDATDDTAPPPCQQVAAAPSRMRGCIEPMLGTTIMRPMPVAAPCAKEGHLPLEMPWAGPPRGEGKGSGPAYKPAAVCTRRENTVAGSPGAVEITPEVGGQAVLVAAGEEDAPTREDVAEHAEDRTHAWQMAAETPLAEAAAETTAVRSQARAAESRRTEQTEEEAISPKKGAMLMRGLDVVSDEAALLAHQEDFATPEGFLPITRSCEWSEAEVKTEAEASLAPSIPLEALHFDCQLCHRGGVSSHVQGPAAFEAGVDGAAGGGPEDPCFGNVTGTDISVFYSNYWKCWYYYDDYGTKSWRCPIHCTSTT